MPEGAPLRLRLNSVDCLEQRLELFAATAAFREVVCHERKRLRGVATGERQLRKSVELLETLVATDLVGPRHAHGLEERSEDMRSKFHRVVFQSRGDGTMLPYLKTPL